MLSWSPRQRNGKGIRPHRFFLASGATEVGRQSNRYSSGLAFISACAQQAQDLVELIEARLVKCQHAAALLRLDGDAQPEHRRELALERHRVGVTRTTLWG